MSDAEIRETIGQLEDLLSDMSLPTPDHIGAIDKAKTILEQFLAVEGLPEKKECSMCNNTGVRGEDECPLCGQIESMQNVTRNEILDLCRLAIAKHYVRKEELRVLEAWHEVFGTTQLTHAADRLRVAEEKAKKFDSGDYIKRSELPTEEEIAQILWKHQPYMRYSEQEMKNWAHSLSERITQEKG